MNANLQKVYEDVSEIEITIRGRPNAIEGLKKIKFSMGPRFHGDEYEEKKKRLFEFLVDYCEPLKAIRDVKL